ncbi:tautomerase family protein [Bacillus altitudinis]|uniref:Phenylpyruvate tautomerase PptA (4-oxalocrotonate tautomerase family) n=2 Tax=Bacillus TaxID=1386 RepID=A0ABR6B6R3_9BACI|nr:MULTISPECIES: tautomerase family protein [Bacillus]ANT55878.1 tautomerase [Bacillus pumilus]MCA1020215.1 tautomerase family protein [Bacillus stratosphericus]CVN61661.1 Tautomerase enzyme [Streptococcus pneumoniae]ATP93186.1 tautomerase family protein [Bacillus altitudinis]MBA8919838.1 phenylpyruvate tautomerase PptA (4-oxalocrotonate tautomerase family) [Bacillus aerius]
MPFVKVNYMEDEYDKESLTSISQTIMKALIKEFQVPKKDYFQVFSSHKKEEFFFDPHYLVRHERDHRLLYIQITCGSGRTEGQKQSLYKEIADQLYNKLHISKENVFIMLIETGLENWSFGEGLAQMIK